MYLQVALKDVLARFVMQGLTQMSKSYEEAIKWWKEWYDQPQLVQEDRILRIMDAVHIKNGSDKELRSLYGAATQHYWALKTTKNDSFHTALTPVILQQKNWTSRRG